MTTPTPEEAHVRRQEELHFTSTHLDWMSFPGEQIGLYEGDEYMTASSHPRVMFVSMSPWDDPDWRSKLGQPNEPSRSRGRTETQLADLASKLAEVESKVEEVQRLLTEVLETPKRGLGAIHTLNEGRVRLVQPVMYSTQEFEDEVLVGVEEVGVYGVGVTEHEAVLELQEELWALHQELSQTPDSDLGPELQSEKRILQGWISNALDA